MSSPETITIGGVVYEKPLPPPASTVGVDLGQLADYTAINVLESTAARPPTHQVRHLDRWRGKPYPELIPVLADLAARLTRDGNQPTFVLDQTGVGVAVVDLVKAAKLDAKIVAVSIHGGDRVSFADGVYRVPKRDLVGAIGVTLQGGRLKIAPALPLVSVLTEELGRFKIKINPETAHDSYSAWREADHDDLVLSVALAVWWAERQPPAIAVPGSITQRSKWDPANRPGVLDRRW